MNCFGEIFYESEGGGRELLISIGELLRFGCVVEGFAIIVLIS